MSLLCARLFSLSHTTSKPNEIIAKGRPKRASLIVAKRMTLRNGVAYQAIPILGAEGKESPFTFCRLHVQ